VYLTDSVKVRLSSKIGEDSGPGYWFCH